MNWGRLRGSANEHVFKGSQLVSCILERHQTRFRSRAAALKFARQLFNDGVIKGVFGASTFEDSVQLYTWNEQSNAKMTSYSQSKTGQHYGRDVHITKRDFFNADKSIVDDVRSKISNRKPTGQSSDSYFQETDSQMNGPMNSNSYFHDTDRGLVKEQQLTKHISSYQTSWNLQRASTASSDSSVDALPQSFTKPKEKHAWKPHVPPPSLSQSRDHDVIPEETLVHEDRVTERTATSSIDLDGASSNARSVGIGSSPLQEMDETMSRRLHDFHNSYSDNEKQLIEQMKRMKKEHSHILRTYEDRINKLMAKMHELRSIAEMLENSSTKSSPYGTALPPSKAGMLTLLGAKLDSVERKPILSAPHGEPDQQAPPLPPRPGRDNRFHPSKPVVQISTTMIPLPWSRVILKDEGRDNQSIWHTMTEPKLDPDDIERLFSQPELNQTDGATLYDDLIIRRGRARQQLVSIYDIDRSKKILLCMRCLRATLTDVIATVSSLDISQIHHDRLVELVELIMSVRDIEKILHYVRKKGAGLLDHPEYLVFELSKVDHFQDRLEFIRFRYKMQWHLFEIDQQLRELYTACDEVTNSISLKNLLETLLSVGNYLNSGTDMGQADGYNLDILNKLKETHDRDDKGTLLEFVLKTYCQIFENEVDIGCPTRFRLPEPSNMRHAAQVSFESIQDALSNLHIELRTIRGKLLDPTVNKDTTRPMDSFRVTAENFFAAALEVMSELDKVLQNTRDFYDRTVRFFLLESSNVTPQQFFQIWAVFLHDCKYFWKLAHKRLARERFELEFKYKGQLSSCSLQGYGSFRAGVLNEMDNSADPKTSTQQRHVNSWVQNLTSTSKPNVPTKPPHVHTDSKEDDVKPMVLEHTQRSPSPKPLTAAPPTSIDVHKPQAQVPNGQIPHAPQNYENQREFDRNAPVRSHATTNAETAIHEANKQPPNNVLDNQSKKTQQFSLKTWLRREREQVRKGVDHETTGHQDNAKLQSPSRSFAKLKSSMFQRFSGASSKKNQNNPKRQYEDKIRSPNTQKDINERQEVAYDVLGTNYHGPNPVPTMGDSRAFPQTGNTNYSDGNYQPDSPDVVISPIDDPDPDSLPFPYGLQNLGLVSPERHYPNTQNSHPKCDSNNNDKFKETVTQAVVNEQIDFNSPERYGSGQNSSLNEKYHMSYRSPQQLHTEESSTTTVQPTSERYSRAQHIPPAAVYKTVNDVNNYEAQRNIDHPTPLQTMDDNFGRSSHGSDVLTGNNKNTAIESYNNPRTMNDNFGRSTQGSDVFTGQNKDTAIESYNNPHITNNIPKEDPYKQFSSGHKVPSAAKYGRRRNDMYDNEKNTPPDTKHEHRIDKQKFMTPGTRVPMNAHSIGSLIDKFDTHSDNVDTPPVTTHQSKPDTRQSKPATMTSTPVGNRKLTTNPEQSNISPPLPPRNELSSTVISPVNATQTPFKSDRLKQTNNPHAKHSDYTSPYGQMNFSKGGNMSNNLTTASYNSPSSYKTPPTDFSANNYTSPATNNLSSPSLYKSTNSHHSIVSPYSSSQKYPTEAAGNLNIGRSRLQFNPTPNKPLDSACGSDRLVGNRVNDGEGCHEEKDEGYKAQLRRAANTSAFDRYGKLGTPYSGRPSTGSMTSQASFQQSPDNRQRAMDVQPEGVSYMAI